MATLPAWIVGPFRHGMCKRKHEPECTEVSLIDVLRQLHPETREAFFTGLPPDSICAARLACTGLRQLVDECSSSSITVQLQQDCAHPHWRAVQALLRRMKRVPQLDITLVACGTDVCNARRAIFACCNLINQAAQKGLEQLQLHCAELATPGCLLESLAPALPHGMQCVTLTTFPWLKGSVAAAANMRCLVAQVPHVRVEMRCCPSHELEHASNSLAAMDGLATLTASCHSNVSELASPVADGSSQPASDLMPAGDLEQLLVGEQAAQVAALHQPSAAGCGVAVCIPQHGDGGVMVRAVQFEGGRLVGLSVGLPQFSCCNGTTDPAEPSAMACDGMHMDNDGADVVERVAGLGQWLAALQLRELQLQHAAGPDPNLAALLPHLLHCAAHAGLARLCLSEPGGAVDEWVCALVGAVRLHHLALPHLRCLTLQGACVSPGCISELLAPGVLPPGCQLQVAAPLWCDVEAGGVGSSHSMGMVEAWLEDHMFRVAKDVAALMEHGARVNGGSSTSWDMGFGVGLKAQGVPHLPPARQAAIATQGCGVWLMIGAYGYKAHWAEQGCWGSTCDDNPWSVCDPLELLAARLAPLLASGTLRTLRLAGPGVGALLDRVSSLEGVELQDPQGRRHCVLVPRKASRLDVCMTDVAEPAGSGASTQDGFLLSGPTHGRSSSSNLGKVVAGHAHHYSASSTSTSRLASSSLLAEFLQPLRLGQAAPTQHASMSIAVHTVVFDGRVDWGQLREQLADPDLLAGVRNIIITRMPSTESGTQRMAAALAGCPHPGLRVLLLARPGGKRRGSCVGGLSTRPSLTQAVAASGTTGLTGAMQHDFESGNGLAMCTAGAGADASGWSGNRMLGAQQHVPQASAPPSPAMLFPFLPVEAPVGPVGPVSLLNVSAPAAATAPMLGSSAPMAGLPAAMQSMLSRGYSSTPAGSHNCEGSHSGMESATTQLKHSGSSGVSGGAGPSKGAASKRQPAELVAWLRAELVSKQRCQDMVDLF